MNDLFGSPLHVSIVRIVLKIMALAVIVPALALVTAVLWVVVVPVKAVLVFLEWVSGSLFSDKR